MSNYGVERLLAHLNRAYSDHYDTAEPYTNYHKVGYNGYQFNGQRNSVTVKTNMDILGHSVAVSERAIRDHKSSGIFKDAKENVYRRTLVTPDFNVETGKAIFNVRVNNAADVTAASVEEAVCLVLQDPVFPVTEAVTPVTELYRYILGKKIKPRFVLQQDGFYSATQHGHNESSTKTTFALHEYADSVHLEEEKYTRGHFDDKTQLTRIQIDWTPTVDSTGKFECIIHGTITTGPNVEAIHCTIYDPRDAVRVLAL